VTQQRDARLGAEIKIIANVMIVGDAVVTR
jgi:hypothetical protein